MIPTNPYDPPHTVPEVEIPSPSTTGRSVLVQVVALTVWFIWVVAFFGLAYIYRRTVMPAYFLVPLALIGVLQVAGTFVYAAVRTKKGRWRFVRLILVDGPRMTHSEGVCTFEDSQLTAVVSLET